MSFKCTHPVSVLQCVAVCCSYITCAYVFQVHSSTCRERMSALDECTWRVLMSFKCTHPHADECTAHGGDRHCNTLQHTATHCNTLRSRRRQTVQHTATHCNTLQHTATHSAHGGDRQCNTLQHTATHCNTLQHTPLTEETDFKYLHF